MKNLKTTAQKAARLLKNIANTNRLMILCLLIEKEHSVSQLLDHLPISQTALSQHLARLRLEKIVTYRRDHRTLYYRILNKDVKKVIATLHKIYCN